jgi:hypothetical protein
MPAESTRPGSSARFTVARPYPGIFQLEFQAWPGALGEVDLAFHLLRFQEHYESPRFKGLIFSWSEYVAWYKEVRGSFSYPYDWSGYNFPAAILGPFRQGAFDPLTVREKAVLQALEGARDGDYVIATWTGDGGSLDHEFAHAFWHLDPAYRRAVELVLEGGDYQRQEAALADGDGYDPQVFRDEIQACAVEGHSDFAPDAARRAKIRELFRARRGRVE